MISPIKSKSLLGFCVVTGRGLTVVGLAVGLGVGLGIGLFVVTGGLYPTSMNPS